MWSRKGRSVESARVGARNKVTDLHGSKRANQRAKPRGGALKKYFRKTYPRLSARQHNPLIPSALREKVSVRSNDARGVQLPRPLSMKHGVAPSSDPRLRAGHLLPQGEKSEDLLATYARGARALLRSSMNTACAPNRFHSHHGAL